MPGEKPPSSAPTELPLPRPGEEHIGPVRPAAETGGEAHEAEARHREQGDLQERPGAEVVRDLEETVIRESRQGQAVFIVLRPEIANHGRQ